MAPSVSCSVQSLPPLVIRMISWLQPSRSWFYFLQSWKRSPSPIPVLSSYYFRHVNWKGDILKYWYGTALYANSYSPYDRWNRFTLHLLADIAIPAPTQHILEAFSHAIPPLYVARYWFYSLLNWDNVTWTTLPSFERLQDGSYPAAPSKKPDAYLISWIQWSNEWNGIWAETAARLV